jgi:hypothetical protein
MKKITFILLVLITTIAFGQNFEGTLSYKTDIELSDKMKKMGLTKEILMKKMQEENSFSSKINYSYKGNNYLIEMADNGTTSKYIGEKNTIYTREKDDDLIVAIDASIDLENLMFGTSPKIEKQETDVIILGKKCEKIVIIWKTGVYEYYYNSEFLKMSPELYKNHKYDMWFEFLNISKSLPLRIVKKVNGMMTIKMDLIDYNQTEIDSKNFELPKMKLDKELTKYVPTKNQKIYIVK